MIHPKNKRAVCMLNINLDSYALKISISSACSKRNAKGRRSLWSFLNYPKKKKTQLVIKNESRNLLVYKKDENKDDLYRKLIFCIGVVKEEHRDEFFSLKINSSLVLSLNRPF